MEPVGDVNGLVDEPPRYVDLRSRPGLPVLRFQRVPESKTVKKRLHLWHYRIMDPEGNEFCLIEQAGDTLDPP